VEAEGLPNRSGDLHVTIADAGADDSSVAVLSGTEHVARRGEGTGLAFSHVTPGRYQLVVTRPSAPGVRGVFVVDTVAVAAGATGRVAVQPPIAIYGAREHLCGRGTRAETRGAIAVRIFDATGRRVRTEYEVRLVGGRQFDMSTSGFMQKEFRKSVLTDASGTLLLCDRQDNEEFFLVDGSGEGNTRIPLGQIRARELLVRHVSLP
jgi:hypothetical protein